MTVTASVRRTQPRRRPPPRQRREKGRASLWKKQRTSVSQYEYGVRVPGTSTDVSTWYEYEYSEYSFSVLVLCLSCGPQSVTTHAHTHRQMHYSSQGLGVLRSTSNLRHWDPQTFGRKIQPVSISIRVHCLINQWRCTISRVRLKTKPAMKLKSKGPAM